jgi:hypothetical protein
MYPSDAVSMKSGWGGGVGYGAGDAVGVGVGDRWNAEVEWGTLSRSRSIPTTRMVASLIFITILL